MASLNKVLLIGTLGRDPEQRFMPNGESVVNFSIACNENWKDKSGAKQEHTEWVNVVMYRKLSEIAAQYLTKGSSVYLEGKMRTRKWEKDGVTRYSTEVIADQMQMLGGKSDSANDGGDGNAPKQNARPDEKKGSFDDFDDDIDFI